MALSWASACLVVALAMTSDAKADALSDTVNCLEKSVVCVGGAAKTQLNVIKASGTVLEFAAAHPNCVSDFVEANPVTIGVSGGMAALKVGGVPTDDAYGQGGKAIAGVLASVIPVAALQNIANSVGADYAGQALQEVASSIPAPSVAVPTVDAQIQCGQAVAKSGAQMMQDVKSVIGSAKSMVKSCGAAASCFADVLKSIVTNPIGALEGVGSALYTGAKDAYNAAGDFLSGQPPNIPSGEYFSKIWYQQMSFLAATYAIQGDNAGGGVLANMYSQCHDYYDSHRMSDSSATETCDQIRGWQSDASAQQADPWPHKSLNQMIQDFINTNSANLVAESYKQASAASTAALSSCPSGNTTCAAKVKQIYKDAADGITPAPNATNQKKIALLMPCVAVDKQSFDVPKCVAPAMATAKMQVDTYTKATKGWTTLFSYADARATLNQMFDDWSAASNKTYLPQCNPGAAIVIGGDSKCVKYIKTLLSDAAYENKKVDIGVQCNAGTKESPNFDLANCLKYTTSVFEPKLQAAVDNSNKEAAVNAKVEAKFALPGAVEAYRAKGVASWKPQCNGLTKCVDTVTGAFADAAVGANKVLLDNCQVDAYHYNFSKCLEAPFASAVMASMQAVNLQTTLDQIGFLAKYVTPYADKCQLTACKQQIAQLGNSWFTAVGGFPYQGNVIVSNDLKVTNSANAIQMKPQSVKFIQQIEGELKFTSAWYAKQIDPFLKQCQHDVCRSAVMELANKWFDVISNAAPVLGQVSLGGSSIIQPANPADADYIKKLEDVIKKQNSSRVAGDAQPNLTLRATTQPANNLTPTQPIAGIAPVTALAPSAGLPGAASPSAPPLVKLAPVVPVVSAPSTTPVAMAQLPVTSAPSSPIGIRPMVLPMAGPDVARALVAAGCVANPPGAVPLALPGARPPATGTAYSCANAAGFSLCEQAKTQPGSGVSACAQRGR